ncbi:unnamed protein product [Cylindrotheca closterium]|uniref:Uncharacterized protein n=1 Tax=Cylindrotheca closterium TaxID=2856 RepID=A0AAD2PVL5_9STRA|nr:unnamed protein product [Cylindrotheca closterium]
MMKRYQMVALDLDGTLLASNGSLADIQADYLRALSEKGFLVCIATGRSATGTYAYAAKLQIPRLPIVCSNGSSGLLWSPGGSNSNDDPVIEEQFQFTVPKPIVQRALNLANKHGFCLQYFYKNSVYANQKSEIHYQCTKKYTAMTGVRIQHIDDDYYQDILENNKLPSKLLLLFDPTDNLKARTLIHEEFDPSEAHIVKGRSTWFVQILEATSNKGVGLRHMCDKLNIPLDNVIAIGDAFNDIEFLHMAGLGVAVKNADSEVKEIADITLDFTNNEHGPMRILQELEERGALAFQEKEKW